MLFYLYLLIVVSFGKTALGAKLHLRRDHTLDKTHEDEMKMMEESDTDPTAGGEATESRVPIQTVGKWLVKGKPVWRSLAKIFTEETEIGKKARAGISMTDKIFRTKTVKILANQEISEELNSREFKTRYLELAGVVAVADYHHIPKGGDPCDLPEERCHGALGTEVADHFQADKFAITYAYFVKDKRASIAEQFPDKTPRELMSDVAEAWKASPEATKQKYVQMAKEEQAATKNEFVDNGKHAIFVLGPSAVGKTTTTTLSISDIAQANKWCEDLKYYSLDGGMIRDVSPTWYRWKEAIKKQCKVSPDEKDHCHGAKDLYDAMKGPMKKFKKDLFTSLVKEGKNLVIPDTATGGKSTGWNIPEMMDQLKANDYTVTITMVYASMDQAKKNAMGLEYKHNPESDHFGHYNLDKARDIKEGKVYSAKGYGFAIHYAWEAFKHGRKNNIGVGNTMLVFNNMDFTQNYEQKTKEPKGARWDFNTKKVVFKCTGGITCISSNKVTFGTKNRVHPLIAQGKIDSVGTLVKYKKNFEKEFEVAQSGKCSEAGGSEGTPGHLIHNHGFITDIRVDQ